MRGGPAPSVGIGRRAAHVVLLFCLAPLAGCGDGARRQPAPAQTATAATPAPAAPSHRVVLGQNGFVVGAVGWGAAHPVQVNVGGDPALVINKIRWHGWGTAHARGVGRASAFNGHGGSWSGQVRVELRAYELGRCGASGPRAYRNLRLRMPKRPGAPMGQWFVLGGGEQGLCRP
jgi:hypothetical protein